MVADPNYMPPWYSDSATLKLFPDLKVSPRSLRRMYRCVSCGKVDMAGGVSPGHYIRRNHVDIHVPGGWLCRRHKKRAWKAYMKVVTRRMQLIAASKAEGYPMTETQFREWLADQRTRDLEQLELPCR